MIGLIIAIHVIVCTLLIILILIQAGRGGGLVEGFSNVESMFGPKTNTFLTRTTTILASLFFISCVGLALLSVRQSRSLMRNIKQLPSVTQSQALKDEVAVPQVPKQESATPVSAPTQEIPKQEAPKPE